MFCKNCGKEMDSEANFCSNCGKSLIQEDTQSDNGVFGNNSIEIEEYDDKNWKPVEDAEDKYDTLRKWANASQTSQSLWELDFAGLEMINALLTYYKGFSKILEKKGDYTIINKYVDEGFVMVLENYRCNQWIKKLAKSYKSLKRKFEKQMDILKTLWLEIRC